MFNVILQLPIPPISNIPPFLVDNAMSHHSATELSNNVEYRSDKFKVDNTRQDVFEFDDLKPEDFPSETAKDLLFFPVHGCPGVVSLSRRDLRELNFTPFLTVRARGMSSPGLLRRTYVGTVTSHNYTLIYGLQTTRNRGAENIYVTRVLQQFAGGARRPWIGPLIVDFDHEGVLGTSGVDDAAYRVLQGLHLIYEHIHPNKSIGYDSVQKVVPVKYISSDELESTYGGDARAAVASLL
ncbi:hypothetical protein VNI00_018069 [Paramarasmius palmivorus]|uniref:Uncharacterized protein n=1 Tax=Paramarasmius palmivorus TaxID=297713 RepID=A0AAW0B204_9AGAR